MVVWCINADNDIHGQLNWLTARRGDLAHTAEVDKVISFHNDAEICSTSTGLEGPSADGP